jgi:hypothetical protein
MPAVDPLYDEQCGNGTEANVGAASNAPETSPSTDKAAEAEGTVSFLSLYQYADVLDYFALTLGVLGALANGFVLPAFSLVFGEVRSSPTRLKA